MGEQSTKNGMTEQSAMSIRRLPRDVVARIAAGEMITRPAAVVKELIENSLDAHAQQITIEVTEALDRRVRVHDDGRGMTRDELALALERYTTSKISREEDLLAIESLGFRGEALASIVEIAKVAVVSRTAEEEHAWQITAEAGEIGPLVAAARAQGTSVTVEDLFFNTPVRKRFLKKGPGEMRLARATCVAYALSAPGVAWCLEIDGKRPIDVASAGGLRERALQLFGAQLEDQLIDVSWREKDLVVRGILGVPELARAGSLHQHVFVNGRWVAAPWIGQAVRHGFGDLLPGHQNPWVVLFLVIPPDRVDVNLHPAKREVRFLDERRVFGSIQRAVHQAVARLLPRFFVGEKGGEAPAHPAGGARAGTPAGTRGAGLAAPKTAHHRAESRTFDGLEEASRLYGGAPGAGLVADADLMGEAVGAEATLGLVSLWQLHNRYVLAHTRKGLLIIDQHAAHERILYEQIRDRMTRGEGGAQQLLFPVVLELDEQRMQLYRDGAASLARMGFDTEEFSENSVMIRGLPPLWRARTEAELLRDLLDEATSMGLREGETLEGLARSYACRAAIKAGEPLSVEEMNRLVDELFATQRPHGDPHGRPTFVFISLRDLDRRFGRGVGPE